MRATIALDDALLAKAMQFTGRIELSALVNVGLKALVRRECARRLALLGGLDQQAVSAPRRRQDAE